MALRTETLRRNSLRLAGFVAVITGVTTLVIGSVAGAQVTSTTTTTVAEGVTPAGPITVAASVTTTVLGGGEPTVVGPTAGTLTGTVGSDGTLLFKKNNINFPVFGFSYGQIAVETQNVASTDWTGLIDPASGVVRINGSIKTLLSIASLNVEDCPIGPIRVIGSSENAGGKPYSQVTSKATVTASSAIPVVPFPSDGCFSLEPTINTTLGLPSQAKVVMALTIEPKLSGSVPVPTTTTTVAPTTTTASPATTAPVLPRTGTSSGPMTGLGLACLVGGTSLLLVHRAPKRRH